MYSAQLGGTLGLITYEYWRRVKVRKNPTARDADKKYSYSNDDVMDQDITGRILQRRLVLKIEKQSTYMQTM